MKTRFLAALSIMLSFTSCLVLGGEQTGGKKTAMDARKTVVPIPAFVKDARILFQGDSITDGNRGRSADPNHILGHGYVFIIAARYGAAYPELNLDFVNRGVSGNSALDLQARWQKDTVNIKPDVLSILVGVNDSISDAELDVHAKAYEGLVADALKANPQLKIVLCLPFRGKATPRILSYQKFVREIAEKYKLPVVDFQKVFDEANKNVPEKYWIWDDVHPTYRGHQLMAEAWIRVVSGFWK